MYSIVFLRRLVKLEVQNEGLGHMNVLGKPTYLCTLKAQPGSLFLTLSCDIKAIQLKPECYLSSVICLPKVKVLYGSFFCIVLCSFNLH